MKLSIYADIRAIGWNITKGSDIIARGIKRVNVSFDNIHEYEAGKKISKKELRRSFRQMRVNRRRYQTRRDKTLKLLQNNGYYCDKSLHGNDILQLQDLATKEKLTKKQLFYVFMNLQKKRGYKSMRGLAISESSEYLQTIAKHEANRKEYNSIAEYLQTLKDKTNVVFFRQSYEAEFNRICDTQELDADFRSKLCNAIYYQRSLKTPPKSYCKYENLQKVCHISNPLYQEFRCWKDVMNIELFEPNGDEINIPFELREKWYRKLSRGEKLLKGDCLKDLGIKKSTGYSWYSGKEIQGNHAVKLLAPYLNDSYTFAELCELWQDVYSANDDLLLANLLTKKYSYNQQQINELIEIDLRGLGWSELSNKAIKKLLPHLQGGKMLKEAIFDAYGKVADKKMVLRNAVLEQNFYSCKSLIEALKAKYNITQCVIEIDPMLKKGNKQRKQYRTALRADDTLQQQHPNLTEYQLKKIKLWQELEVGIGNNIRHICPYDPYTDITFEMAINDDLYNIDHIVPKSKIYERGFVNYVLCPIHLNEKKSRRTGIEFAEYLGITDEYLKCIENYSESKKKFFLMRSEDIPINYISSRQGGDYNTRCYMTLFKDCVNIPHKLLNMYYKNWAFNIYSGEDAHSALAKSFVLANMSQETVDYFDKLQMLSKDNTTDSLYNIQPMISIGACKDSIDTAGIFMPRVKFIKKTKNGYIAKQELHEQTVYGQRQHIYYEKDKKGEKIRKEDKYYKIRKDISSLTPAMIEKIQMLAIRNAVKKRIDNIGSHKGAMDSLIQDPIMFNNRPVKRVSIRVNGKELRPIHSSNGKGKTFAFNKHDKKVDFVYATLYRMMEVYKNDDGKIIKNLIKLIDYVDKLNKNELQNINQFTLTANDVVELDGVKYYVLGAAAVTMIRPLHIVTATKPIRIKSNDWIKLKKLHINQLGEIISERGI